MRDALMATYSPPDLVFSRGEGAHLFTEEGNRYLDFISGIAVTSFGHAHPHLVAALQEQSRKIWHLSNMFRIPAGERLAKRLCEASFASKIFFSNSGAESVECGLKTMRRYHFDNGNANRFRIIGMNNAFHGRTLGTISAAGNPGHTEGFIPDDQGYDHVPYGDIEAVTAAVTDQTAGIILEPIQGEGGINPADTSYLKALRKLCDDKGILLMFDEVQCGMGRSGKLFAHEWSGVSPDLLAAAKGMGGGFPVGACLATEKVAACMVVGTHGSTFGGNPLAMAVGNAVLDLLLEENFLAQVQASSELLQSKLNELIARYPNILGEISGRGLMLGLTCQVPNTELLVALRTAGLLVGKAGNNMIRLLPPLNISDADIDESIKIIDSVCSTWTD